MELDRSLLACIRKADYDFNFIEKGETVLLGLSGGKDSMVLAKLLSIYSKFKSKPFHLIAAFIDLGFGDPDIQGLKDYCDSIDLELVILDGKDVAPILYQHVSPSTNLLPCSICSRMKKAIINKYAINNNISKVCFAHHADDCIETVFLNMIYGGRINTFEPKMYLERDGITFIRPFIYVREKDIKRYVNKNNIPVYKNKCPNDKLTKRQEFKELLDDIYKKYPSAYDNFLTMLTNRERFKLPFEERVYSLNDGTYIKKVQSAADAFTYMNFAPFVSSPLAEVYLLFDKEQVVASLVCRFVSPCLFILDFKSLREDKSKDFIFEIEKIYSQKCTPLDILIKTDKIPLEVLDELNYKHNTLRINYPILDKQRG